MADERKELAHTIVHVRPDRTTGQASTFEARLARVQHPVRTFTDVYRTLAYVLLPRSTPLTAIIVNVDGLGRTELEFFSILARRFPSLNVCVYGGARAAPRIEQALECGAKCRLTDELLGEMLTPVQDVAETRSPGPVHEQIEAPPPATREGTEDVDMEDASVVPASERQQPAKADEEGSLRSEDCQDPDAITSSRPQEYEDSVPPDAEDTEPARVPWLNYRDRPQRAAPSQREAPANSEPRPPQSPSRDLTAPLLTDEELKALLSDDIAAIAPRESHLDAAEPSEPTVES